jgi:hypothetical protein
MMQPESNLVVTSSAITATNLIHGYSRDSRGARPQLVIGLLCASDGCPVAVEVSDGNTADPATVAAQITKLKQRFRLRYVVLVGDRAHQCTYRTSAVAHRPGLDHSTPWPGDPTTAEQGVLQFSLFDTGYSHGLSPVYPAASLHQRSEQIWSPSLSDCGSRDWQDFQIRHHDLALGFGPEEQCYDEAD